MAWITTVGPEAARAELKELYDAALKRAGKIYNIVRISSLSPNILRSSLDFYMALMHATGGLTRTQREMIAVAVSRANHCFY